ncbi:mitogen-activated protein kinase kinase kinase 14-like isoform X2 [Acipenser ruthenus]|uniref:mitogen-activated protein kinase kinase kinase 14-like isoform X2 n=1 Tax=Acipenser ruthenus TaxID=7906 RepID=UPI00145A96C2|nr:mitogen-activated protein kinase kinase kinase 14-like isoform X2 [Acipenser ruthenus]
MSHEEWYRANEVLDTFSSPHPGAHCPFSGALFHLSPSDNALYLYLNDTAGDSGKSVPALEEESDFSSFKDEPAVIYGGEKELQQFGVFCVDLQKLKKNHKKNCHKGLLLKKLLVAESGFYREGIEWLLGHNLGSGKFGTVFEVIDTSSQFKCAAKKVELNDFKQEELEIWKALSGPHVVELFGAVLAGDHVIFFMQMANGGSLSQLINKQERLCEIQALFYFKMILDALEYLQKQDIIHNDIKGDNMLLSDTKQHLFLCDFSFAEKLRPGQDLICKGKLQGRTQTHMAPEVAKGTGHNGRADVWSATCTLLHMINGRHPWMKRYHHLPSLDVVVANNSPPLFEIPKNCHREVKKLIRWGLTVDHYKRPQASSLRDEVDTVLSKFGYLASSPIEENCETLEASQSFVMKDPVDPIEGQSFSFRSNAVHFLLDQDEALKAKENSSEVPETSLKWTNSQGGDGNKISHSLRMAGEDDRLEIIKAFQRDRLSTCNSAEDLEEWISLVDNTELLLEDDVME